MSRNCSSTLFGIFVKDTAKQKGVRNMNLRSLLLPVRSLAILVTTLGFQQMLFGHHAEVMKGNPLIQGLSMPLHGLEPKPQHCYSVKFKATELWGSRSNPNDLVFLDLFDDYLEESV